MFVDEIDESFPTQNCKFEINRREWLLQVLPVLFNSEQQVAGNELVRGCLNPVEFKDHGWQNNKIAQAEHQISYKLSQDACSSKYAGATQVVVEPGANEPHVNHE
jgi:hypothetical protein